MQRENIVPIPHTVAVVVLIDDVANAVTVGVTCNVVESNDTIGCAVRFVQYGHIRPEQDMYDPGAIPHTGVANQQVRQPVSVHVTGWNGIAARTCELPHRRP